MNWYELVVVNRSDIMRDVSVDNKEIQGDFNQNCRCPARNGANIKVLSVKRSQGTKSQMQEMRIVTETSL
jgi:hypothetical protein